MERKIFLDSLPKKNNGKIDWRNSVGSKVHFIYDNIDDYLFIEDRIDNKNFLIEYNNKKLKISYSNLSQCKIGSLFKNFKNGEFKLEIGQHFNDDKRDLYIIDREYRNYKNNKNQKHYKYHCNKCGNEDWIKEVDLTSKKAIGCNVCANKKIKVGINDLATTHPHLIKYLANKEDGYKYSSGSDRCKIKIKCPDCGFEKKLLQIHYHIEGLDVQNVAMDLVCQKN